MWDQAETIFFLLCPLIGGMVGAVFVLSIVNAWQWAWRSRYAIGSNPLNALAISTACGIVDVIVGKQIFNSGVLSFLAHFGTFGNALANAVGTDTACVIAAVGIWVLARIIFFRSDAVILRPSYILVAVIFGLCCGEASSGFTHYVDSTFAVFGL